MKGSIRMVVGFFLVFGAVGGMDTASNQELLVLLAVAALGLASMASGVKAMERAK